MGVSLDYVAKETATNLWRNRMMALAGILTVAVSLSLVGTALLLRQAVNRQIGVWSGNVNLQVFMEANTTNNQTAFVRSEIAQTPQISSCQYLNHEQSYQQAKRVLSGIPAALNALTPATTPPVFQCKLKSADAAGAVASIFYNEHAHQALVPGVYYAEYPGQTIKVMSKVTSVLQIILFVVALVLLVSSLALILNAIRMAIFNRRREIGVMKLVGATDWFIRIPFMLEGLVQGLLGALVAVLVVLLSNVGVNYLIHHYLTSSALPVHDIVTTEVLVVLIGGFVGVAGSMIAIRRFMRV